MKDWIIIIIVGICLIGIGYFGNEAYRYYNYQSEYKGLWIPYINNKPEALEKAYNYDTYGNWICINIRDSSFEEIINTCEHEAGHELFARACAKNETKCLEYANEISK